MPHLPIDIIAKKTREVLDNFPDVFFATIFGSAVHDRLTPSSDVDIAVAGKRSLSYEERVGLQIALSHGLNYEVDLIDLQAVSGLILKEVLCSGKVVLNKVPAIYAQLMKKMWYNQEDMMPNTKMILKKKCLRFVNG